MKPCTVLKEWTIESVNYDGESRKMLISLKGCMSCKEYQNCVATVRYASLMDDLAASINPEPTKLDEFIKYVPYKE